MLLESIQHHGKGDTNRQGIDGSGNCQQKQFPEIHLVGTDCGFFGRFFFLLPDGFQQHFPSDKRQQKKCNPVAVLHDMLCKQCTQQPTCQRHECLKAAKEDTHPEGLLPVKLPHLQSFTNRNCKGIHRKTDSKQTNFTDSQIKTLRFMKSEPCNLLQGSNLPFLV